MNSVTQDNVGVLVSLKRLKKKKQCGEKKEKRSRPDFKNRNISLPETDFLKGKLMMVYSGADSTQWDTLSPARQWSEVEWRKCTISKVQTIVRQLSEA